MGFRAKKDKRWPGGIIYYTFDHNLPTSLREPLDRCIKRWETLVNAKANKTVIKFREDANAEYRVLFQKTTTENNKSRASAGSVALTAAKANKPIVFELTNDDQAIRAIPHEVAHIIGLAHEHVRRALEDPKNIKNGEPHLRFTGSRKDDFMSPDYFYYKPILLELSRYEVEGDYDVRAITHYPSSQQMKLEWNQGHSDADLNLPSVDEVTKDPQQWEPSAGDLDTIIKLYS